MKRNQPVVMPEGWTREVPDYAKNHLFIGSPGADGGFVTVDFTNRCYRSGINTGRTFRLGGIYQGLCWRQRLEQDAIDWLARVMSERETRTA